MTLVVKDGPTLLPGVIVILGSGRKKFPASPPSPVQYPAADIKKTKTEKRPDLRDQIFLLKRLSLFFFILKKASTKLPFHIDRRGMN